MAALSIRGLDEDVREQLRLRAARNGRSMEAEARAILSEAVRDRQAEQGLFETLLERFGALGGVELDLPSRSDSGRVVDVA